MYGLWLNLGRVRYQKAEEMKMAMEAIGDHRLDKAWFDGIAWLEEQIDPIAYRTNAARADMRAMKRAKTPGGLFGG